MRAFQREYSGDFMTDKPELLRTLSSEPALSFGEPGFSFGLMQFDQAGGAKADADRRFRHTLDELVEGFSEQLAIVDEDWTIIAVNGPWTEMVRSGGYFDLTPGRNYREFLRTFTKKGRENAAAVLAGIEAIERNEANSYDLTYAGIDRWEGRTLQIRINRLHIEGRAIATVTRHDLTDAAELRRLRKEFTSSVMQGQAEERRRLARELHDSTAQLLTSVGLLLAALKRKASTPESLGVVREMEGLVCEAQQEIRSISYLSQPAALQSMSLAEALEALVGGFERRTGIATSFDLQGEARLSEVDKASLYRVAQEALSNVHRHASATRASVCLYTRNSTTHLVIADNGVGISLDTLARRSVAGVGLSGMRSRLAEIGGRLTLRRRLPGTAIFATIPAVPTDA